MAKTKDMENMIESLTEWNSTPKVYFKLASLLLEKILNIVHQTEVFLILLEDKYNN